MEKYIFSGNMQPKVFEILKNADGFDSMSLLCTQLERSTFRKYIGLRKEGFCDFLMVDSGAYSVFTGTAKTTIDQYIDFINQYKDDADVFVELDTIPGEWRKPKKKEHYKISAEKSWEDFLYMRERVECPEKIMPVFHSGESFETLERTLDWKDENGNPLDYIGISAAKDASNNDRDVYLNDVVHTIKKSSNPNVKIHLFGTTALKVLSKVPCYSCDSTTHVRLSGFGQCISQNFGSICVTPRGRKQGQKFHFMNTADTGNLAKLQEECDPLHITTDDLANQSYCRCAFNIYNTQVLVRTKYKYNPKNMVRKKSLI